MNRYDQEGNDLQESHSKRSTALGFEEAHEVARGQIYELIAGTLGSSPPMMKRD